MLNEILLALGGLLIAALGGGIMGIGMYVLFQAVTEIANK